MQHDEHLSRLLASLGISDQLLAGKRLPFCAEAETLTVAQTDGDGREHRMTPAAAQAWHAMRQAAHEDGVTIYIVSAFRDLERQAEIIRAKLAKNMPIETILTLSAPPGYSEHHTGRAIDINTPGCEPTEEPFERTDAFRWLNRHAERFGFALSYPRGNALGFIYEPWHWLHRNDA